ncbi:hypothetical protein ACJIZ3_007070 [Penstemon smallii]|uniref:Amino acid transporter transmembrane domain-containing protein n=1 Tax=Penstemon smallii TaxID=265156 RepID=A0ABD3S9H5_9LAMI
MQEFSRGTNFKICTVWTAIAHIITGVIGAGVLSLAWSTAQLGWVAGPLSIVLFAAITQVSTVLVADCYRSPDPEHGPIRNRSFIQAVKYYLGESKQKICGVFVMESFYGCGIAYTIVAASSVKAISRSDCYHDKGQKADCGDHGENTFMLLFGLIQIVMSQIPNFHNMAWLSVIAAIMSFSYAFIGLGLGFARVVEHREIMGSIGGIPAETAVKKVWLVFQSLGDIAFAYPYTVIILEIQDTLKTPPAANRTMKKVTLASILITTFFYLCCGCFGYAAFGKNTPGNLLTGFGFYEPYWLVDFANACIILHLVGGYQVYSQPVFAFVEKWFADKYPQSGFINKFYTCKLPLIPVFRLNMMRLCFRTLYVISTTGIAMAFPYFNQVLGVLGALNFWPLAVYFPVQMYFVQSKTGAWTRKWVVLQVFSVFCLGTIWTALAHIITAVIGSGVLSLAWSMSQLGWIAGPLTMLAFASVTLTSAFLLCNCYLSPDLDNGFHKNVSYLDAVDRILGKKSAWVCGIIVRINFIKLGIVYTITSSISMRAIQRSNCFHVKGHKAACKYGNNYYMLIFGIIQVVLSQIPDFRNTEWLSVIASIMSFTYSIIGSALGLAKVIENGEIKGSIGGVPTSTAAEKVWSVSQALGDIAFAFPFSLIFLEITDTLRSNPPEKLTMKKASITAVCITTFFYLCCGGFGYAAFGNSTPGNLLTGFGFYEPYWLIDFANACVVLHLVGGYQKWFGKKFPENSFVHNDLKQMPALRLNLLRLCFRTVYVGFTTGFAMLFPYFNQVVGVAGAINFWPVVVYFPVEMYLVQKSIGGWTSKAIVLRIYCFITLLVILFAFVGSIRVSIAFYNFVMLLGTVWTAIAHIITGVIGAGVLSLAWSTAQLGWVAGPLSIVLFAAITQVSTVLVADCYRSPDPEHGPIRNRSFIQAVKYYLGESKQKICGVFVMESFYGCGIAYTIVAASSVKAISRSDCYHDKGQKADCGDHGENTFMLLFGLIQIVMSQIPNFHNMAWLSVIAAIMSFSYAFIGLGLGFARVVGMEIMGSIGGIPAETAVKKVWLVFQSLGDIAFAYPYTVIILEIQDTLKTPPAANRTMKKVTLASILITTFFYLCCGCFGYAAFGKNTPGNLLTGFGFYEPYWLVDFANACIILHLVGGYQVYSQPVFAFVEKWFADKYPESGFINKFYTCKLPLIPVFRLNMMRLCFRTLYVISTTGIAMAFPYFNQVLGVLGALNFWPLAVYFPVQMYFVQSKTGAWTRKWAVLQVFSVFCLGLSVVGLIGSVVGLWSAKFS